jgi:putative membrane protein
MDFAAHLDHHGHHVRFCHLRGLLGKLSARFGEGTVNGILTARVGLAARDVCRPIPQETSAKDTLGSLMKELVSAAPQEKAE